MAQVPILQPTERLRPINQQGMTTQANADDFGAAKGRGMAALAQGVGNLSDVLRKVKTLEAEATTKDRDVALSNELRDLQYNPETGFMNAEGKSAVEGWDGFQKRVDELIEEHGKGLTGEAAVMYRNASQARKQNALQTGIQHTGSARKTWFKTASESRIAAFQEDAFAAYGDEKAVQKNIAAGLAELQTRGEDQGWDRDTLKNEQRNYISAVRTGVVKRMVETDAIAAEKYYNAHKDQFTGSAQYALETAMKEGVILEKSKREAGRILDEMGGGSAPGVQGNAGPRIVACGDLTLSMIRGHEGFRSTPYWDVNHWRVGFGSDTFTRADGTVGRVTTGVTVSRADGERDLQRRAAETQQSIAAEVGADRFRALPPGAQAALTSVAYNYGNLPDSVAAAVRSGDVDAIASAISGLGGHNGGINRSRRNKEAAMARGDTGGSPSASFSFTDMETKLGEITDPDVREMTRKRLNSMMEAKEKQEKAVQKQAELQLFSVVDNGGTPDDVSSDIRLAAGMSSVSSAWSYHEAKLKRGEPETDQTLLYELRRSSAVDPQGFAERNLMEYRDRLDNAAFKEMTDQQTSVLKDTGKAVQTGAIYEGAYKQADTQLASVGLTTTGVKDNERQAKALQIAQFQNALKQQIDEFTELNKGRVPNYSETQQLINRLLLPVVIQKEKSVWDPTKTPWTKMEGVEGFAFEAPLRPDGTSVELAVQYEQIPIDIREDVKAVLASELGRTPSPEEVVERYEAFLLGEQ